MDITELMDILDLEELDTSLFRGQNYVTSWKRVFGGQVLGQALNAAYRTIPEDRIAHSLHGYFILGGDVSVPIIYQVDTLRDGGSFSTRRVTAIQKGRAIFVMAASFQLKQEGIDHQSEMPNVPGPSNILTEVQQVDLLKEHYPDLFIKIMNRQQSAIEFRPIEFLNFEAEDAGKEDRHVWMKLINPPTLSLRTQHELLAYASDYDLLLSALYPHRKEVDINKMFLASIDHAMYFHREFDFSKWLLYVIDSPSASNARGIGYGKIFNEQGVLVSTVIQEGLIRRMREKSKSS